MFRTILLSLALPMWAASPVSLAQPWPAKPIRIIAPFAPGGGADFMARLTSQPLAVALGQPVVVENRVGASGIIGYDHTLKSLADGNSLVVVSTTYSIIPALYKLPYDPVKDMQPIIALTRGPYIIAVHPSVPAKNIRELIALAKAAPDGVTYASSGNGANLHLVTEMFASMAKIKMLHVPFKGTGPAITATVGGQTSVVFGSMYSTLPLVRAGRLRALAVSSAQRNPAAPEIPTVAESGLPGYDTFDWQGVVGPKGIPRPVVDRLNAEFAKILQTKEVADRLLADGIVPSPGTPEEFGAFIAKEIDTVRNIVTQAGIKLE